VPPLPQDRSRNQRRFGKTRGAAGVPGLSAALPAVTHPPAAGSELALSPLRLRVGFGALK